MNFVFQDEEGLDHHLRPVQGFYRSRITEIVEGWGTEGPWRERADVFEKMARFYLEGLGYLVLSPEQQEIIRKGG